MGDLGEKTVTWVTEFFFDTYMTICSSVANDFT